jgi:hypothetical protein
MGIARAAVLRTTLQVPRGNENLQRENEKRTSPRGPPHFAFTRTHELGAAPCWFINSVDTSPRENIQAVTRRKSAASGGSQAKD